MIKPTKFMNLNLTIFQKNSFRDMIINDLFLSSGEMMDGEMMHGVIV